MSLVNYTYRSMKKCKSSSFPTVTSPEAHWEDATEHSYKQNGFFLSDIQETIVFPCYIYNVCVKEAQYLAPEIIYLPTTFTVSAISLTPFSMTVFLLVITYHLKTCWIESYHSVSKTAEIYDMEMKEKQLWTFMHPTVWLIFNTWPAGPIWTHPLNQQGSPKNKPTTFNLELLHPLKDDCNICDRAKLFPSKLNTFHNTGYFF